MATRVAVNGFGRVGRAALRSACEREADIEWVAVNDLVDPPRSRICSSTTAFMAASAARSRRPSTGSSWTVGRSPSSASVTP